MAARSTASTVRDAPDAPDALEVDELAGELRATLGALYRRIRQTKVLGDLSLPETVALSRLRSGGPTSAAALAKHERISPQSMAATVAELTAKGLIARAPDPADGRRILLTLTDAGTDIVESRRSARTAQLRQALEGLDAGERAILHAALPLLERLAEEI